MFMIVHRSFFKQKHIVSFSHEEAASRPVAPPVPIAFGAPARPFEVLESAWSPLHDMLNNRKWQAADHAIQWIVSDGHRNRVASLVFRGHRFFTFYVDGDGESPIFSTCFYMFLHVSW